MMRLFGGVWDEEDEQGFPLPHPDMMIDDDNDVINLMVMVQLLVLYLLLIFSRYTLYHTCARSL